MNLIKLRLNKGEKINLDFLYDNEIELEATQVKKGAKWLYNLGFTPKGAERKNNPYGGREEEVVKDVKSITLLGFENINFWSAFYVPHYRVSSKDNSFDYYMKGGKIEITG